MQSRRSLEGGHKAEVTMVTSISIFSFFVSILQQDHAKNPAKRVEIGVSELLKLKNVLCLNQVKEVSRSFLYALFFFSLAIFESSFEKVGYGETDVASFV